MVSSNSHYFLAIPLPDNIKQTLSLWQHDMAREVSYKQWTHKEDFHITLKFLGGVSDDKIQKLIHKLESIKKLTSFEVNISDLHTFGNPTKPRVLWAGVQITDSLLRLQATVESLAYSVGFIEENRPYQPHITLGKKWNGQGEVKPVQEWGRHYEHQKMMLSVDRVVLYRIEPKRMPKYYVQEVYSLLRRGKHGPVN